MILREGEKKRRGGGGGELLTQDRLIHAAGAARPTCAVEDNELENNASACASHRGDDERGELREHYNV